MTSTISEVNSAAPTWTVRPKHTEGTKGTNPAVPSNELPDTARFISVSGIKMFNGRGHPTDRQATGFSVEARDDETGTVYEWRGNRNNLEKYLISEDGTSAKVPSGRGTEILRSAAEQIRAQRKQSEKESFTTKEGETVTWWTETDEKDRDYKMYCYEASNGGKAVNKEMCASQLNDLAKRDQTALEVYCRVKGRRVPDGPMFHGSVDTGGSILTWSTSPVEDGETGQTGFSVGLRHKGDTITGKTWMTLDQIEKESRKESVGDDYKLLLKDITTKLAESLDPNRFSRSGGGNETSSHGKGPTSSQGSSKLSKL